MRLMMFAMFTVSMGLSATEFHVRDFGAKGDGVTNDGPAIRKAIAAAIEAGPGTKVVFEKKRYRLGRTRGSYQIDLKDVTGLTIEGNGAELINTPYNGIVRLEKCEDVTIRGFVIDFDPLPFTQGTISAVDLRNGTFELKLHKGYANPVTVYHKIGKKNPDWGWGTCMDPKERKRKVGVPMHFHIRNVKSVEEDLIKVTLRDRNQITAFSPGDRFVMRINYGGRAANISVQRSKNCRLESYTIYAAKCGMTHSLSDNRGRIYVKGVKITFKPGSDRLIVTPSDGFHCKHNAVGPVIEDCLFEGLLDDSINISVCPYWVREDLGNNRYLIASGRSPHEGDRLMAYRPSPETVMMDLVVTGIERQPTPRGMRGTWNIITLNKPIPNLGLHKGKDLFPGGKEKMVFTGLYNLDASGKNYIIRNNVFRAQRRHALLARAPGGVFENNIVDGVGGCGVALHNETLHFYEGPIPADTVIRNNTFSNTYLKSIDIYSKCKSVPVRNITIVGNRWRSATKNDVINLRNVQGAVLEDNLIIPGNMPVAIQTSKCKNIIIKETKE